MSLEKMPGYDGCFVCDTSGENPRSLSVNIYWDNEKEEIQIPFRPDETWCGFEGIVHGGILAALTDDAMSWALKKTTQSFGLTASLSIRYLRPVKTGGSYKAIGTVYERKGRKVHTKARIVDEKGKVHVDAKAIFVLQISNNK